MVTIEILDGDFDKYSFTRSNSILGRKYDNESEYIKVIKPESETSSVCTMIITNGDTVVDHLVINEEPIPIRSNVSQYDNVAIGFSFSREDGYIKNSEIKLFSFLRAQKPDDFVPLEPQQQINIDHLIGHAIINVKLNDKELDFYDVNDEISYSVDLAPFFNIKSNLAEEDETSDSFVENKSTKYLKNEGADGTSPYATEEYVDKNGGKIDTIKVNDDALEIENKSVNILIPTKTNDLLNDSGFITSTVNDLINYYSKTSIDEKVSSLEKKISAIPQFSIDVVDTLPSDNISVATIYLLKTSATETGNLYTEYIYVNNCWESLGTQKLDLTGYATEEWVSKTIEDFLTESDVSKLINEALLTYSNKFETIAFTGKLSDAVEDAEHRTITDSEKKDIADNKSASHIHSNKEILDGTTASYTAEEKEKLSQLNNYDDENVKKLISEKQDVLLESQLEAVNSGITAEKVVEYNKYALDIKELEASLPDVSEFITRAVSDLTYYYTKNSIDTKVADLQSQISAIPKFKVSIVSSLPTIDISETTIYLLKTSETEIGNLYTEYIYLNGSWESLGTQTLDLTGYATEAYVNNAIADFLTQSQILTLITNSLVGYVKASQLATIATSGLLSDAIEDSTHRVVTDAEKESWNLKITKEEMEAAIDNSIGGLAEKLEGV